MHVSIQRGYLGISFIQIASPLVAARPACVHPKPGILVLQGFIPAADIDERRNQDQVARNRQSGVARLLGQRQCESSPGAVSTDNDSTGWNTIHQFGIKPKDKMMRFRGGMLRKKRIIRSHQAATGLCGNVGK